QMDPVQMVNRLTSNAPFTKNFPLIGINQACDAMGALAADPTKTCGDLPHAPNVPLGCVTTSIINTVTGALIPEPGGARCDIPLARFGEFCAPAIAGCTGFDPKRNPAPPPPMPAIPLTPDEEAAKALNEGAATKGAILGGYTCQPNTSQGGYCFYRCDVDASAGSKTADKVDITYKGPDGQSKKDKADLPYDNRCGNIPGYKCLNPAGTIPNQMRVCLRQCDTGKPDTFNDEFCKFPPDIFNPDGTKAPTTINERVTGNFQKGMTCSTRGLNGSAGCQWDPA